MVTILGYFLLVLGVCCFLGALSVLRGPRGPYDDCLPPGYRHRGYGLSQEQIRLSKKGSSICLVVLSVLTVVFIKSSATLLPNTVGKILPRWQTEMKIPDINIAKYSMLLKEKFFATIHSISQTLTSFRFLASNVSYYSLPGYRSIYILLCIILPMLLIGTIRYDLIFDKTTRSDYDKQYPGINKLYSLIKLFVKYQALSLALSYVILIYVVSGVSLGELKGQSSGFSIFGLPGSHIFWKFAILGAAIIFLVDILRYILRSRKIYDIFISYKSADAEVVRKIAERLMFSGLNVWFAEYEILLTNRRFFQWFINKGIKLSKYVIAFTSDDHAKSRHCNKEISLSLKYQGIENIIEIVMHEGNLTHDRFPELANCSAIQFNDNIEEIIDFVEQKTGFEIKPIATAIKKVDDNYYSADYLGSRYMVNVKRMSRV